MMLAPVRRASVSPWRVAGQPVVSSRKRTAAGWELVTVESPDDAIALDAIDATLSLKAVWFTNNRFPLYDSPTIR